MKSYIDTISKFFGPYVPATDYLARVIVDSINTPSNDPEKRLLGAGSIKFDLREDGSYKSGKKTFVVKDRAGFMYRVTVENLEEDA